MELYKKHPYKEVIVNSAVLNVPTELYQRRLDPVRANKIAEKFDERLLNDPKVSWRDGRYFVFDGQHTLEAMKILNGNKDLLVRIRMFEGMTAKDEAMLFAKQFGESESVAAGARIRALIYAEDPTALAFQAAVRSVGFELDYSHQRGKNRIGCISAAYKQFKELGAERFTEVLTAIREAWDGDSNSFRLGNIVGLCQFAELYRDEYSHYRLVKRLSIVGPMEIYQSAKDISEGECPGDLKYLKVVWDIYNGTSASKALPRKF